MKSVCLSVLLFLPATLPAQSPEPARLPGEPHHHLKIDNSFVRAYYVEVAAYADTQLHQHDHDYIFVTLGATDVINAVLGKPEAPLVLKDGEVHFSRGGFAHVARNLSDKPFRNVTIEFLRPQDLVRNVCAEVLPSSPVTQLCHYPTPEAPVAHSSTLFETSEITAELHSLGPGTREPRRKSKMDRLLAVYDGSQMEIRLKGEPPRLLHGGDLLWIAGGRNPFIRNVQAKPARYFVISFKDSGTKP